MLRLIFLISLFCLMTVGIFAQEPSPEPKTPETKAELYYRDALTLMLKEENEGAFRLLRKVIELSPDHVGANYLLSKYASNQGNFQVANLFMDNVLKNDPQNYWARYMAVNLYMLSDGMDKAIAEAEAMSNDYPHDISLLNALATLYYYNADYEQSLHVMDRIEQLGGDDHFPAKVTILESIGRYEEAAELLEQLSDYAMYKSTTLTKAAEYYQKAGNAEKAFEIYHKLLEDDPASPVISNIANCYRSENRMDDFYQWIEDLVCGDNLEGEDYAKFMETLANDSESFTTKTDSVFRDELFKKAMKVHPGEYSERAYLSYLKCQKDEDVWKTEARRMYRNHPEQEWLAAYILGYDYDDCSDIAQTALEHNPEDPTPYYYYLAYQLKDKRQYEDVLKLLVPVVDHIEVDKRNSHYSITNEDYKIYCLEYMGESYRKTGKTDKAYECYDRILEKDPSRYDIVNNYAFFLALEKKNLDKAETMMREALDDLTMVHEDEDLIHYLDTYAFVLFQRKRYPKALEIIERALDGINGSLNDEKLETLYENETGKLNANVLEHAGDIYYMNKQPDKALEYWNKAKQSNSKSTTLDKKIKKKKYVEY